MKQPVQYGKYLLLERINVGGMAEVFKAKAFGVEGFERIVAVKRILPSIAEDNEFITMFVDEAKIAVQLSHANICQIFDLGKVESSFFIALEFVHGKDLRVIFDRCRQRAFEGSTAMPIAQACFITMKACEGLDYAHNKRDDKGSELHLVHRDVSPQNILISYEGDVKLIDFGIAKAQGKNSKTEQGILKGKFGYMSPEQVRGLPVDRRSDVFALGIVLYELLTGERLFVGESDFSTLEKVRNVEVLPPSTFNRKISPGLERIVMKALGRDVEDRYQNAIDLHDDLQAYMYAAGEFYSRKDLAAWMKRVFVTELTAENVKLESYQHLTAPTESEEPRQRKRTLSPGGPPPPPTVSAAAAPALLADVDWDDEELATNIYEPSLSVPVEATMIEHVPDLSEVDLSLDGAPVPHARQSDQAEAWQDPTAQPGSRQNGTAKARPATKPPNRFDLPPTQPTPLPNQVQNLARPLPSPPFPVARLLWIGVPLFGLVLVVSGVRLYLHSRPGVMQLTTDPSEGVSVYVDDVLTEITHTPAEHQLSVGRHKVQVVRDWYSGKTEAIEIKSNTTRALDIRLEPMSTGSFKLLSEPSGAEVLLDGQKQSVLTPLQVDKIVVGKHTLDVRSAAGHWSGEIVVDKDQVLEVHAPLQAAAKIIENKDDKPASKATVTVPVPENREPEATARHIASKPREPKRAAPTIAEKKAEEQKPQVVKTEPAKKEEKPPEIPVAASGDGTLRVNSRPWTNITVDGKDTGLHTPQAHLKLSPGAHRITLSNPQFHVDQTISVDIRAGGTETLFRNFQSESQPE